ncbi:hypothetical protein EDC94DRAFT_599162 [Helicostylum pulchrum]|nr:hypothetical protein EDC94DRAFT_599162 [Helicostylum pulchrum]
MAFLDPGRKSVYTAFVGLDLNEHQIRHCSTKEYYHLTGYTAYAVKQQKKKDLNNITVIESGIPSCKTTNADTLRSYARYMLINMVTYLLSTDHALRKIGLTFTKAGKEHLNLW